jgi:hypothetical protein
MKRLLTTTLLALATIGASAATTLGDRAQIVEALKISPPCCVVDARSPGPRLLRPLKDAVAWSANMRIVPSGTVVVIADNDKAALVIARRIEKRFKAKDVLAVKGGVDTWREILAAAEEPGMPATFVIPKNTCEQGTPLQTLRSNKR